MKRVLTILAILLLPLSVWAMTPVTDSDLSDVTGQAGVSINVNVAMNVSLGTMAWGDSTGVDASTQGGWTTIGTGGYIGITGFELHALKIRFRDDYSGATTTNFKPLTIDVATVPGTGTLSARYGDSATALTFVRIGLGSIQVGFDSLSLTAALGTGLHNGTAPTLGQKLGYINIGAFNMYINPSSYIDISNGARTGAGVTMGISVTIDSMTLAYMNWGGDGFTNPDLPVYAAGWVTAAAPGYIGLNNFKIAGPITAAGVVNIDVGTSTAGLYYLAHGPEALVHISFGNRLTTTPAQTYVAPAGGFANGYGFEVATGAISADVVLSSSNTFASGNKTLGDIYISNFKAQIYNGSWVDIMAH